MPTFLDAARLYSAWGWRLFPCDPSGKQPLRTGGFHPDRRPKRLKWTEAATGSLATLSRWHAQSPTSNWALATGKASGVVVIDVDLKGNSDGGLSLAFLMAAYGKLPPAPIVRTPSGGYHLYFRYPPAEDLGNPVLAPGLDIKAEGGYVLLPPSLFRGKSYLWDAIHRPDRLPLPLPPFWLIDLLRKPAAKPKNAVLPEVDPAALSDKAKWAAQLLGQLAAWRCDDYPSWVAVGMALSELGSTGLSLWDSWSRTSPKHKPGDCLQKWQSFQPGHGLTLGSLFHWSIVDGVKHAK